MNRDYGPRRDAGGYPARRETPSVNTWGDWPSGPTYDPVYEERAYPRGDGSRPGDRGGYAARSWLARAVSWLFTHLAIGGALVGLALASGLIAPDPSSPDADGVPTAAAPAPQAAVAAAAPAETRFVETVSGLGGRIWAQAFAAGAFAPDRAYAPPALRAYRGAIRTPCGAFETPMGPQYCPTDRAIYVDPAFIAVRGARFDAPGPFADAFLIAHEHARHVQDLTGMGDALARRVTPLLSEAERSRLSIRRTLEADCLTGVWAGRAGLKALGAQPFELDRALRAAFDFATARAAAAAAPAPSAERRARWFEIGYSGNDPSACDTFAPSFERL